MPGAIPMHALAVDADERDVRAAIDRVLASGRFILGPEVDALETELAAKLGAARAVGCASGSDALLLALRALGVGPGDEVITTAFSFIATAEAIVRAGARPVFADIDPTTFTLDPKSVEARITSRTRAIVPVHLYGHPADVHALVELASARQLAIIEDAAQAIGARTERGAYVGAVGDLGVLSFYPTKNLGALGDAGMVLVGERARAKTPELEATLRSLRVHGFGPEPDVYVEIGMNSRLDAIHAAVLRARLGRLDEHTAARRWNAARYDEGLAGVREIGRPAVRPGAFHVYNQYTVRVSDRGRVRAKLREAGVDSAVYYAAPLHVQPCFRTMGVAVDADGCPEAMRAAREVLSLPIRAGLEPEEIDRAVEALRAAL